MAAAASAASTALPPRSSALRPARVASGWLVATIASALIAGMRLQPLVSARPGWKRASRSSSIIASIACRGKVERRRVQTVYTSVMSPVPHPFDVDETQRALVERGGGYEVVHSSPGSRSASTCSSLPSPTGSSRTTRTRCTSCSTAAASLEVEGTATALTEGMAIFVPAGAEHRFTAYEQLALLVVFNGPHSG